ncbi:MAG: T9SS type A sorting domain-containing protein [Bacteroidota bacterium]|jgi:hypothetical protein
MTLFLIVAGVDLAAQTIDHWWLPEHFSRNERNTLTLHEVPNGIICLSTDDSSHAVNPVIFEEWNDLSLSVVDGSGEMHSVVLRSIGPFTVESISREEGGFEHAVVGAGASTLLATTSWSYFGFCTGSRYSMSAPLRLEAITNTDFRPILDHTSGRKPSLLRTRSGVAWMTWEAMTASNPVEEFPDRHYRAEIRVARLSSDDRMEISYSLGPGYSPTLVERADGTVFVLYRIADHSEARENFSIQLTSLCGPGGGDAVVDDGLSIRYWWTPELFVRATADNSLAILMDRVDSVVVYHCDAAANVTRSAAVAAGNEPEHALLLDHDRRMVLLWRKTAGEDIVWTPLEEGRMFKSIDSIPGTASITEWKSFQGQDGNIKIITHPTGAAVLNIIPNATSSTPITRELYSPDTFWGTVLDWHLDRQDALWIAHRQEVRENRWQTGLYRVCDLTLPATTPSALVESAILYPNSPNPFMSSTTLRYSLPTPMQIHLLVHDALGREIRHFGDSGVTMAGMHTEDLESAGLLPGVYFYSLIAGGQRQTRKMVLLQ